MKASLKQGVLGVVVVIGFSGIPFNGCAMEEGVVVAEKQMSSSGPRESYSAYCKKCATREVLTFAFWVNAEAFLKARGTKRKIGAMQELLLQGADINVQEDTTRRTVLHKAAIQGDIEFVLWLLENNANPTLCDYSGETPAVLAWKNGFFNIVLSMVMKQDDVQERHGRLIGSTGFDYTLLYRIALMGNPDDIREALADDGISFINVGLPHNCITPLMLACQLGNVAAVEVLIEYGASCLVLGLPAQLAPLSVAAKFGRIDVIELLLKKFPILKVDEGQGGVTPLRVALDARRFDMADLMLSLGVAFDFSSQCYCSDVPVANYLLKKYASLMR